VPVRLGFSIADGKVSGKQQGGKLMKPSLAERFIVMNTMVVTYFQ